MPSLFSSLHPAFAALPSAHPARGVDDELRWGPISMRVCTTCFAPSGPREVWDAALFHCGDRFLLARPMPSSSPMACIAHVRSHSCFARPHHAARGLGDQALRQPRLRAVVASSVLDAPSRQHGCRGPRAPRGVWASCMRTATECARRRLPIVTAEPRVPPPNAQESERAKACKARRAQ